MNREPHLLALEPPRYHASRLLEAVILARAPAHYATPDAPSTLEDLRTAWANRGARGLPVFDGGCERTIYSSPAVNHAFRAWHDSIHVEHGFTFDGRGEFCAACVHWDELTAAGLPFADVYAMHADVWGQFLYADRHDGEFPRDQAAFVAACFARGIERAASGNY